MYRMGEDNPDEITSIEITKGTRTRLRVWKAERGMTYGEALNELLDGYSGEEE